MAEPLRILPLTSRLLVSADNYGEWEVLPQNWHNSHNFTPAGFKNPYSAHSGTCVWEAGRTSNTSADGCNASQHAVMRRFQQEFRCVRCHLLALLRSSNRLVLILIDHDLCGFCGFCGFCDRIADCPRCCVSARRSHRRWRRPLRTARSLTTARVATARGCGMGG